MTSLNTDPQDDKLKLSQVSSEEMLQIVTELELQAIELKQQAYRAFRTSLPYQGYYSEVELIQTRILEINESIFGPEHLKVAAALYDLAVTLDIRFRRDEAKSLLLQSLSIQEKNVAEHEDDADILNMLALTYVRLNRYSDAEPLFSRTLGIREKIHGSEHVDVAESLDSLADLYDKMERYTDAEQFYQRALQIREKIHGSEHEDVTESLSSLADFYEKIERYTDAESLFKRALEIREKMHVSEHEDVAESLDSLADLYEEMERYSEAEPLCLRALAIKEKIFGHAHVKLLANLDSLADLYDKMERYKDAEPFYLHVLEIREKVCIEQLEIVELELMQSEIELEQIKLFSIYLSLADLYQKMDRYIELEALYLRALTVLGNVHGPEHEDVALTILLLASLYKEIGQYSDAEPLYQRLLAIREKMHGQEHEDVADVLDSLAKIYHAMERYSDAESLYQRALAIFEEIHGQENEKTANVLSSLAAVYLGIGNFSKSENLSERAKKIYETSHGNVVEILRPVLPIINANKKPDAQMQGILEKLTETQKQRNLELLTKVKAWREWKIADIGFDDSWHLMLKGDYAGALKLSHVELDTSKLDEISSAVAVFTEMGLTTKAESLLKQLIAVSEAKFDSNDHSVIEHLNELAELYTSTERYNEAEALLNRSLLLCDQVPLIGGLKVDTLCALTELYAESGRYDDALIQIMLAIVCSENNFGAESTFTANTLEVAADIFIKTGRYSEAESYIQRCLVIQKSNFSSRHPIVSELLMKLAEINHNMCRDIEAESLYQDALSMLKETVGPDHPGLAEALIEIAEFYKETNRLPAAAMLGKLAVNIMQKTRHSLSSLDKETRKSFDDKYRPMYTELADILVESERYPEAEQVLAMLKEEQSFAFVRRDSGLSSSLSTISFTPAETELLNLFSVMPGKVDKNPLSAEELCALDGKDTSKKQAVTTTDAELQRFFDSLVVELGAAPASKVDRESDLQADLWDLPTGTVAIYAFAAEHNFRLILNTPEGRHASSCPIKCSEFNRLIFDFRQALQQPVDNIGLVKELGKKLYDIVLAPVEAELLANKTHTILWMVEGLLQCMPFAALHDGSRFIVERFANVLLTPRSKSRMHDSVQPHWNALGMATTRGDELHSPLGFALGEISAIIRDDDSTDGVLSGTKLLDEKFTWGNVKGALRGGPRFQAIHIATHFHLNPVNDSQCYLLLGDGQKLSLETFRKDPDVRFNGVDIVALSACSTALNLALNNGREIDGIAGIAESKGAKSVLATLWPVEDESTSFVMQTFYRLRESGLTKGEALRMAQMALLIGDHNLHRGHDYAHPFFWAPFILIGNWK
ncbi:MAG: tetratricopeptide repeat protein [Desulfuromonadaceae bacterium]